MEKEIRLLDANLEVYGDPIDSYTSFVYTEKWSDHDTFSATLPDEYFKDVKASKYIYFDGKTFKIESIKSVGNKLTIGGRGLSALFDGVAIYVKSQRVQGKLETEIRDLVTEYAMSGAQAINKLVLGSLVGYATAIDAFAGKQSLADFLFSALPLRGYSFALNYNYDADEITFDILYGENRSQDDGGDSTVIFSTGEGNIENVEYAEDDRDEYNFAYVNDEDDTDPQIVEVDLSQGEPVKALYVSGKNAVTASDDSTNLMIMVGAASAGVGYIATSTDGHTWTARVTSGYGQLWGVDYQNGKFIAGGGDGTGGFVLVSTDGITWTQYYTGGSYPIEGVGYHDGLYFAFTSGGAIGNSYDAITWAPVLNVAGKTVNAVYANNRFVAYGYGVAAIRKAVSADGTSWTYSYVDIDPLSISSNPLRTCYCNGKIIAVGYWHDASSNYYPFTVLSDGFVPTETVTTISSLSGRRFLDAAYGVDALVAVGQPNIIAYSTDYGLTWTDVTPSATGTPDWITITFDGEKFHAYSATTKHHAYSTDGINFTVETISISATLVDAVVYGTSTYTASLYQQGIEALQAAQKTESIAADALPNKTPTYGADYSIGDKVDIIDPTRGIMAVKRVEQVQHVFEPQKIITIPKFGTQTLGLREFIKREAGK